MQSARECLSLVKDWCWGGLSGPKLLEYIKSKIEAQRMKGSHWPKRRSQVSDGMVKIIGKVRNHKVLIEMHAEPLRRLLQVAGGCYPRHVAMREALELLDGKHDIKPTEMLDKTGARAPGIRWGNIHKHVDRCDIFFRGGGNPAGTKKFFDDNAALMSRLARRIHGGDTLYVGLSAGMFYDETRYLLHIVIGRIWPNQDQVPDSDRYEPGRITMTTGILWNWWKGKRWQGHAFWCKNARSESSLAAESGPQQRWPQKVAGKGSRQRWGGSKQHKSWRCSRPHRSWGCSNSKAGDSAAVSAGEPLWHLTPKTHQTMHMPKQAVLINPVAVQYYKDESFVGVVTKIWQMAMLQVAT